MLVPMIVAAIYTSALIFGPAFLIVLAICLASVIRFPRFKSWIGAAMIILGLIEVSLIPDWALWVFLIGFSTSIVGVTMLASGLLGRRDDLGMPILTKQERSGIGLIGVVIGVLGIALFSYSWWGYALGLALLVAGTAGAAALLPESRRAEIGLGITTFGSVIILIAVFSNFITLAFFVGIVVMFVGFSIVVSGLSSWVRSHSSGNLICHLKKVLYVSLSVVIFSSSTVYSLRATHFLREELYDVWRYQTTADTRVRGIVAAIYLNYEVNNRDYSYHIFPALIIVKVTEVLKVAEDSWSSQWENLTEANTYWVNQNMTIGYDKPDVPSLTVGLRVEARGYYDTAIEDSWSYSDKLVIAQEINDSYIRPL